MLLPRVPVQHHMLLPQGMPKGPMPWVLSVLTLLTLLITATGLSLTRSADAIGGAIADRVTIEITTPDSQMRLRHEEMIQRRLVDQPYVHHVEVVAAERLLATFDQWFAVDSAKKAVTLQSLPLPSLIDVDFIPAYRAQYPQYIESLRQLVAEVTPNARVSAHADWLAPIVRFIDMTSWVSGLSVLLMIFASCAVVVMAVRMALSTHYATIEILHLVGATDDQISRLFQRRIAIDSLYGTLVGAIPALIIIGISSRLLSDVTSGLADTLFLGLGGWGLLLFMPFVAIMLSVITARFALLAMLEKIL